MGVAEFCVNLLMGKNQFDVCIHFQPPSSFVYAKEHKMFQECQGHRIHLACCFKSARPTNTKQQAASRAGALPAVASCRRMIQVEDALDQLVAGANPGLCKEVCSDYFRTSSRRLGSLMATFPVIDPSWSPRLKGHD